MAEVRECRLRPEYDYLYDGIPSGGWRPAREVAERLVAQARKAHLLSIHLRTFDARHFEFRGGAVEIRLPSRRTRVEDVARWRH
jgi:hypothetical protein